MLTKNLLKFSVRKQRVYPKFIDPQDIVVQGLVTSLMKIYKDSSGKTVSSLQEQVAGLKSGVNPLLDGFNKLLLDRVSFSMEKDAEAVLANRWSFINESQSLRQEKVFESLQEFYENFESRMGKSLEEMKKELYCDLPECQVAENFESINEADLVHRYNCAQIQGLLINANSMTISLKRASLSFKRYLFRQIKFHRLLVDVKENSSSCFSFELSGPLSVFSSRQTYSLRIANFFPHVLHAKSWKMSADLTLKDKRVDLCLDDSIKVKSHYSLKEPYIPKELLLFVEKFNKKQKVWKAKLSTDFLNLGKKNYCFPDLTLLHEKGRKISVELFHRWHFSQLLDRIKILSEQHDQELVLGCSDSFLGKTEIKEMMKTKKSVEKEMIFFKDFPTSTKILKYLENYK